MAGISYIAIFVAGLLFIPATVYGFEQNYANIYKSGNFTIAKINGIITYNDTDSTRVFKDVFNALPNGGLIEIDRGNYHIYETLFTKPTQIIHGQSNAHIAGKATKLFFHNDASFALRPFVELESISLNFWNKTGYSGGLFLNGDNIKIDNVFVENNPRSIGVYVNGHTGGTFETHIGKLSISQCTICIFFDHATQVTVQHLAISRWNNAAISFQESDHNYFSHVHLTSPYWETPGIVDVRFGHYAADSTNSNVFSFLTGSALPDTFLINNAPNDRPNYIWVFGADFPVKIIAPNNGTSNLRIDHTTLPFFNGY
jgi:hypothetical protein